VRRVKGGGVFFIVFGNEDPFYGTPPMCTALVMLSLIHILTYVRPRCRMRYG